MLDTLVKFTVTGFSWFWFMALENLSNINFKLQLFTTNFFDQFDDCWMGNGNTSRKYFMPAFDRVVRTRKVTNNTVINAPKCVIELWFLSSNAYNKRYHVKLSCIYKISFTSFFRFAYPSFLKVIDEFFTIVVELCSN